MIKEKVLEIIEPILEELNVSLYEIDYEKVGKEYFLRIYIDAPQGVDLDLCVAVTEKISPLLDEVDLIDNEYYLEVASPGAERPLKTKEHIEQAIGKYINVKLYEPLDGMKEFEGNLLSFIDDLLTIEVNLKGRKKSFEIPYSKIAKARLAIKF